MSPAGHVPMTSVIYVNMNTCSRTARVCVTRRDDGDLDVSVIDELPPGRKPIRTLHRYDNKKAELYAFLREESVDVGVRVIGPVQEGRVEAVCGRLQAAGRLQGDLLAVKGQGAQRCQAGRSG